MSLMQLVLDFFAAPPVPVLPDGTPVTGKFKPEVLQARMDQALADPEKRAPGVAPSAAPPMPEPAAPAPVPTATGRPEVPGTRFDSSAAPACAPALQEFRHPDARRELVLELGEQGSVLVAFALERVRRRSIGFTVSAAGLAVRAPSRLPLDAVDDAVRHKAGWIVRKLHDTRTRAARQAHTGTVWQDGAVLPYLGTVLHVRIDAAAPAAGVLQAPTNGAPGVELRIRLPVPRTARAPATLQPSPSPSSSPDLHAAALRGAVHAWMLRKARAHFIARLDHFAPLLGVQWQRLALSNARTRWGSAKSDGSIRLNWRLLHCEPAVLDYVVAHELAHLRVMDHSPRFWATVATVVPDHAVLRRRLRDATVPHWEP